MDPNRDTRRAGFLGAGRRGAFTVLELLVSVAIVALLVSVLLPALASVRTRARSFKCQVTLRSIALDFMMFAQPELQGSRGDDDRLGRDRFRLETFQESLYRVDEFWGWGSELAHEVPDAAGNDPMRCTEMGGEVTLRRNAPCSSGAVGPPQNVSFGFNRRLHRAEDDDTGGRVRSIPVVLTSRIVSESMVPLVWDVDGVAAKDRGSNPVYSGPTLSSLGPYADDRYWYPSLRHATTNFAFVDGHVESSRDPLSESGWRWGFQTIR